jgi:hypothetical protein
MDLTSLVTNIIKISALVIGTVEPTKKLLKWNGWKAVLLTIVASAIFCLSILPMGWAYYLTCTALVCLSANGLFQIATRYG